MKKTIIAAISLLFGISCGAQQYTNQDNAQFSATIDNPATQLVDVRTPEEFAQGHIPGAVNIDIQSPEFDKQVAQLDKTRPVAVYCRSGARSGKAAARLAAEGFELYNLNGGILGWNGKITR